MDTRDDTRGPAPSPPSPPSPYRWSNAGFRWSIAALAALTVASLLAGFVWLPSAHRDFLAEGLWASLCRAAGLPDRWGDTASANVEDPGASRVFVSRTLARTGDDAAVGRGATIATAACTMCHGAQGMSTSGAPNLAGQFPEVVVKQLQDYRSGHRVHALMQGVAAGLGDREMADLAAYYASLPKARTGPTLYTDDVPQLVRQGDPMRGLAPCIACHGGADHKLGSPWLEGMPRAYLVAQLQAFASGQRRNDPHGQMRTVARAMTPAEIEQVATFYAGKAAAAGVDGH